ncbi:hypothetical protein COC54_22485 [Bacillus pseudomycoides]|nr:hypothetical protein CN564_09575 [Bacillus pseudomycoides]PGR99377.1 hypothetical protein COC54_22485 [Bacillus pseudomycoides]PHC96428.1 hypothetical protein COF36_05965 [Bacillus pseudomycoides]
MLKVVILLKDTFLVPVLCAGIFHKEKTPLPVHFFDFIVALIFMGVATTLKEQKKIRVLFFFCKNH